MKLTPMKLSKEPMRFVVEAQVYDFSNQRRTFINPPLTVTVRGTQTHDGRGRPVDNDND
jgi:hypothetical protein